MEPNRITCIDTAMEFIYGTSWKGSRLGLSRVTELLGRLGGPHRKMKFVHIAGTNGKGSTAAMIESILSEAGYKTGLFTSPYIRHFNEMVKVGGVPVSDDEIIALASALQREAVKMADAPTEYEIITAMAFLYFVQKQCDIVVLEVGMGGRLDATNVIDTPEVAVITAIGMDHMEQLGDTEGKIAGEKAGIIKTGGVAVCHPQTPSVERVFRDKCAETNTELIFVDSTSISAIDFVFYNQHLSNQRLDSQSLNGQHLGGQLPDGQRLDNQLLDEQRLEDQLLDGQRIGSQLLDRQCLENQLIDGQHIEDQPFDGQWFSYNGADNLFIPLLGRHQLLNAAVAIETVKVLRERGWGIQQSAVKTGLRYTKWPGRFEILRKHPIFIIDAAHNVQGINTFIDTLNICISALYKLVPTKKPIFIFGVLADKEYEKMAELLAEHAQQFVLVTPDSPRALPAKELEKCMRRLNKPSTVCQTINDGVKLALETVQKDGIICAVGSFSMIGAIKECL